LVSRIAVFASHPRRTLGVLATALLAVGVAVGSGANFTAESANAGNLVSAGTLSVSGPATAILNATNLKPGDTSVSTADIQNTGSLAGTFKLVASDIVDTVGDVAPKSKLSDTATLTVKDCGLFTGATPPSCTGATQKASGLLSTLTSVGLGSFAAGARHRYEMTVTFPDGGAGADNGYQGASLTAALTFSAVS
jgi:spore coat-associated protein N